MSGASRIGLVVVVVVSGALAGCFGPSTRAEDLARYKLVLHPVNVSWDSDRERVYGNVTLSNLHAEPGTNVSLFGFRLGIGGKGLAYASAQTPTIHAGDTYVLNYSVHVENGNGSRALGVSLNYDYMDWVYRNYSRQHGGIEVDYVNPCLRLGPDGSVGTEREGEKCRPLYNEITREWEMSLVDAHEAPPVELWSEWERMDAELEPVHAYLQDFAYREANVTYFNGTIRCPDCSCSSLRSSCHASDMSP